MRVVIAASAGRHRCYLRWVLALAAILAPVLAGCAGQAGHRLGPPGQAGPRGRLGLPRYYVTLVDHTPRPGTGGKPGEVIYVHETATGRVNDTFPLTPRMPGHDHYFSSWLAAAADQRTFFVAHPQYGHVLSASPVGTGIYRFGLTGSGQVTGFTEVAHGYANANGMITMAASPDGTKLALSDAAESRDAITVVDLATGRRTVWRGGLPAGYFTGAYSWEADNRTLAFLAAGGPAAGSLTDVRTLDTTTTGGSLAASHRIGTVHLPEDVAPTDVGVSLSPDGQTITVVLPGSPNSHDESPTPPDQVIQISTTSGHQKVIYSAPSRATIAAGPDFGSAITSDGNGHLLQGGATGNWPSATVELAWTDGGTLHQLPAGSGYGDGSILTGFAW